MNLQNLKNEIEDNLSGWIRQKSAYLAHFFCNIDKGYNVSGFKVGYYIPSEDKIATIKDGVIESVDEVFKEGGTVPKLNLDDVKFSIENALEAVCKLHPVLVSGILILQCLDWPVYNVTVLTPKLTAVNVRVDARNLDVIRNVETPFFSMK